jgi:hypothetical protein
LSRDTGKIELMQEGSRWWISIQQEPFSYRLFI